jgi:CheY-like chemotaxis protein
VLRELLEEKGYEVHTATSGEDARKTVAERFFDPAA